MRIAFIVNSYPPRMGGLELHIQNLAHELSRQGHNVWVLTISTEPGNRIEQGVRVVCNAAHFPIAEVITFPSLGATRRIHAFLKDKAIDVVSTHTRFFPMSFVGVRAARRAGIPVVHTEHGSDFVAAASPVISIGSRAVDLTLGRYVLSRARRVLAVSPQSADFVRRLSGVEATVFYNAITLSKPRGNIEDRPNHLVFVGRVVAGKGWDRFLEAIAALRADGFDVDGELLGAGAELELARERAGQLGVDHVVSIPGRVDQSQVRRSLAGATLVNPTVLSEGFQTTLLEALAERGRVVTFDVPGAQVLADQGAPVFICGQRTTQSLTSALKTCVETPMPLDSEDLISSWTWPERAKEYIHILQSVLT